MVRILFLHHDAELLRQVQAALKGAAKVELGPWNMGAALREAAHAELVLREEFIMPGFIDASPVPVFTLCKTAPTDLLATPPRINEADFNMIRELCMDENLQKIFEVRERLVRIESQVETAKEDRQAMADQLKEQSGQLRNMERQVELLVETLTTRVWANSLKTAVPIVGAMFALLKLAEYLMKGLK